MNMRDYPIVLTIAGSDSGGGAGIQADLKTFQAFGVFGTSALTAITSQNTLGVHSIHSVPLSEVKAQIDAVVSDLRPLAFKTGMLATQALTTEVGEAIERHDLEQFVLDPVMIATSGDRLLEAGAETALRDHLMPRATVVTPNLEEASVLTGAEVRTLDDMRRAARRIVDLGPSSALVKGGHLAGDAVDIFWDGHEEHVWRRQRIDTVHTHGTGCTLSAAITAGLALGRDRFEAIDRAIRFVADAIAQAPGLGAGRGPVNHLVRPD
jgi:hydroxymethylpyrimidine kinase/phosphomethylpyrimidine kinase